MPFSVLCWVLATLLTSPEPEHTLRNFYRRTWRRYAEGVPADRAMLGLQAIGNWICGLAPGLRSRLRHRLRGLSGSGYRASSPRRSARSRLHSHLYSRLKRIASWTLPEEEASGVSGSRRGSSTRATAPTLPSARAREARNRWSAHTRRFLGLTPGGINSLTFESRARHEALLGEKSLEQFWLAIGPEIGLETVETIRAVQARYRADEDVNREVLELIHCLHSHHKLAVLSNPSPGLAQWLRDWEILELFDVVFC